MCTAARKPYSITSSARASSVGGTVRPRALAVIRLITRLNLVGCSTGRSPGFAPPRILWTYSAARRARTGRRYLRPQHQCVYSNSVGERQVVQKDVERVRTAVEGVECGRDVVGLPDFQVENLKSKRTCRCLNLASVEDGTGIDDIDQDRQPAQTGDNLAQQFESLASKVGLLTRQPGDVAARSHERCDQAAADGFRRPGKDNRNDRCRLLCREGC